MSPPSPDPEARRRDVRRRSIVAGVLWTAAWLVLGFAGAFQGMSLNTPLFAAFAVITGALFGLMMQRGIREARGLDREYRPVGRDGDAGHRRPASHRWFAVLFLLLILVFVGVTARHYLEGSCGTAWQCLRQGWPTWSNWFFLAFLGMIAIEWIEKRLIERRRRSAAADGRIRRAPD